MPGDTTRLREALRAMRVLGNLSKVADAAADNLTASHEDRALAVDVSSSGIRARLNMLHVVRADLEPVLDELEVARQLARDVLSHGLFAGATGLRRRALEKRLLALAGLAPDLSADRKEVT